MTQETYLFLPLGNNIGVEFLRQALFLINLSNEDILAFEMSEEVGIPPVVA